MPKRLLAVASCVAALTTANVAEGGSAQAAATHPSYAKGCNGTVSDLDCWHQFAGKTWPTRDACTKYALANGWWDGAFGTRCTAEPPSGRYTMFVFMPYCKFGLSAETCRKDGD
jgi:hypothetical protein